MSQSKSYASRCYLLIANMVPLFGVGALGWSLYELMLAYWLENAIIGLFTIFKIALAEKVPAADSNVKMTPPGLNFKLFLIVFFSFHYGIFTLVHGVFVYALFGPHNPFNIVESYSFWPALATFCFFLASHGFSFLQNYIGGKEYRSKNPLEMMISPYGRVAVMHIAVLASGFILFPLGFSIFSRYLIVGIKTSLDYLLHSIHHGYALTKNRQQNNL